MHLPNEIDYPQFRMNRTYGKPLRPLPAYTGARTYTARTKFRMYVKAALNRPYKKKL